MWIVGRYAKLHFMSIVFKPNNRKRKTTHGFLVRKQTAGGRQTILRRRRKGRAKLAP